MIKRESLSYSKIHSMHANVSKIKILFPDKQTLDEGILLLNSQIGKEIYATGCFSQIGIALPDKESWLELELVPYHQESLETYEKTHQTRIEVMLKTKLQKINKTIVIKPIKYYTWKKVLMTK